MSTRAKFTCRSVTKRLGWRDSQPFVYDYQLDPVTGGNEENERFFEATPAGQITLSAVRDDHFEVGRDYYVDFTEVPEEAQLAIPEPAPVVPEPPVEPEPPPTEG
jgi:hypothetical protein